MRAVKTAPLKPKANLNRCYWDLRIKGAFEREEIEKSPDNARLWVFLVRLKRESSIDTIDVSYSPLLSFTI